MTSLNSNLDQIFTKIALNNIDGLSYDEAKYYLENGARPDTGTVSGLIYYTETDKIYIENWPEILGLIEEAGYKKLPIDQCNPNNIVWLAWSLWLPENIENILKKALKEGIVKDDGEEEDNE